METIKDIITRQFNQIAKKTEDLKTDQKFLWANDKELNKYKHETPPEPIQCEFCRKKLYYRGLFNPFVSNTIFRWISPNPCDCKESVKHRLQEEKKQEEELKQKEEQDRKAQEQAKIDKLFEMSKLGERFKTRTFESFNISNKNKNAFEIAKAFSDNFEEAKKKRFRNNVCRYIWNRKNPFSL